MGFRYSHEWVSEVMKRGGCVYCMEDGTDHVNIYDDCPACEGTGLDPARQGTYHYDGTFDDEMCKQKDQEQQ